MIVGCTKLVLSGSRSWWCDISRNVAIKGTACPRVRCMSVGAFTRSLPGDLEPEPAAQADREAYQKTVEKFQQLLKAAEEGGGQKGIDRHVKKNRKMLIRDRLKNLLDPGTELLELGKIAGFEMMYGDIPAAGVVAGIGLVNGTYCILSGNDATVQAGTYFPITLKKSLRIQEIAEQTRLPTIYLPDSGGAFLPLQAQIFLHGGRSFYNQAVMSSKGVYQIALVCGSCTAGGAYNPTMSDEAIIVDRIGKIFLGGPPLVKAALGEVVSDEELGGGFMHSSVSGCTDYFAATEEESFEMCRNIIESLNMRPLDHSSSSSYVEPSGYSVSELLGKEHFDKVDVYTVIGSILDGSKFNEFKAYFGTDIITGSGYIQGTMVGVVANCGEIRSAEALKAAHFLTMCNKRKTPVIFLQNSLPSPGEVHDTDLRDRGKMSSVVAALSVPKISLTLTSCLRDDAILMCGPAFNPSFNMTWPNCKFSSPDMTHSEDKEEKFDAFDACHNMLIDTMIQPEETRTVLGNLLHILKQKDLHPENQVDPFPVLRM